MIRDRVQLLFILRQKMIPNAMQIEYSEQKQMKLEPSYAYETITTTTPAQELTCLNFKNKNNIQNNDKLFQEQERFQILGTKKLMVACRIK